MKSKESQELKADDIRTGTMTPEIAGKQEYFKSCVTAEVVNSGSSSFHIHAADWGVSSYWQILLTLTYTLTQDSAQYDSKTYCIAEEEED